MTAGDRDPRLRVLPDRRLPLLYIGTAHVSLALAFACAAYWPRAVVGFFYHSWMVALVHLVTLGWITLSMLGALYIVAPVALRTPLPARRSDYVAYGFVTIGLAGLVAHFWIQEFIGMAWCAALAAIGAASVMARVSTALWRSPAPAEVKLHIWLAAANFLGAATAGTLLGFDKTYHFLPGFVLTNVFAHAHLAAIGWATMMAVGVAYRLLPMVLPTRPPSGRSVAASAILLETGVIVLFAGLVTHTAWALAGGVFIAAGLACFFIQVNVMASHPRPRPAGAATPDYAVRHAVVAGIWLMAAVAMGLVLLIAPMSERSLRLAMAYGVAGLIGFLSQLILGLEVRLLPMHAWYWQFADTDFKGPVPAPHAMGSQRLRGVVFCAWLAGVPLLALGFFFDAPMVVSAGAWALLAGVVIAAVNGVSLVRCRSEVAPERPAPDSRLPYDGRHSSLVRRALPSYDGTADQPQTACVRLFWLLAGRQAGRRFGPTPRPPRPGRNVVPGGHRGPASQLPGEASLTPGLGH